MLAKERLSKKLSQSIASNRKSDINPGQSSKSIHNRSYRLKDPQSSTQNIPEPQNSLPSAKTSTNPKESPKTSIPQSTFFRPGAENLVKRNRSLGFKIGEPIIEFAEKSVELDGDDEIEKIEKVLLKKVV